MDDAAGVIKSQQEMISHVRIGGEGTAEVPWPIELLVGIPTVISVPEKWVID